MKAIESSFVVQSCTLRLEAILPELKPAERRVASYILDEPQDVLNSTIQELAVKTETSYATVTRLIARIGLKGFKELKKLLYEDTLHSHSLDTLDVLSIVQGTSAKDICQEIYELFSEILRESYNLVNADVLEQAADLLLHARTVCFVGTGLSALCAHYAYNQMMRIGINCIFDEDCTNYKIRTSLLEKEDVLFAVSSSGRSMNILECAKIAQENEVPVISLSDYAISPLTQLSTVTLFTTPRNSARFMHIDMPLLFGQIYLLASLFALCCSRKGKAAAELFSKTCPVTDAEKVR
ncbi:MAG: MurR/RpiR family transcriptional regulator [Blautia sp.]|nr:MurR/RpiR family transcriptional regulator [Blautia sp.]